MTIMKNPSKPFNINQGVPIGKSFKYSCASILQALLKTTVISSSFEQGSKACEHNSHLSEHNSHACEHRS